MHRINLYDFTELYFELRRLEAVNKGVPAKSECLTLSEEIARATRALSILLSTEEMPLSAASLMTGNALLIEGKNLGSLYVQAVFSEDDLVSGLDLFSQIYKGSAGVCACYRAFVSTLTTNLREINAYIAPDVGLYNVNYLLEQASSRAFDKASLPKIEMLVLDEFDSSAKCLAFELSTACGFHILRANEAMMKSYMLELGIPQAVIEKCVSWYDFAKKIKEVVPPAKGNIEIGSAIENMRVVYRNPIMHPEDTLTQSEADILFGSCRALMVSMVRYFPDTLPMP